MKKYPSLVILGNRIRKLREEAGFSQEDFATHAQLGRSFYGRIERGEQNVSVFTIIKIAIALNVEISKLFPSLSEFKKLSDYLNE